MNLELPSCSCFDDFTIGGDQVALDAGDCLSNRFPDGFCSDEACLPFKCRVDIDEHEIDYLAGIVTHDIGGEEALVHLLEQAAPAFFALLKRDLGLLARGDVEGDADEAALAGPLARYHLSAPCNPANLSGNLVDPSIFGVVQRIAVSEPRGA